MIISVRLDDSLAKMVKENASRQRVSVSEFIRQAVYNKIKNNHDSEAYMIAIAEHKNESYFR